MSGPGSVAVTYGTVAIFEIAERFSKSQKSSVSGSNPGPGPIAPKIVILKKTT